MSNTRIIHVTAAHIAAGKPGVCAQCPVALALLDVFPNQVVNVDIDFLRIGDKTYCTPVRVEDFIWDFDTGMDPAPFSFRMPVVYRDWSGV